MNVILDVSRMQFDGNGVKGFAWPLTREEVVAMRDALLSPLVVAARGRTDTHAEVAELLSIVIGHFVAETMALYQAHALSRRLGELGYQPIPSVQSRLLPALAGRNQPQPAPLIGSLMAGPPRAERWTWVPLSVRRMWRLVRFYEWNGLSLQGLRPIDPMRDIVAIQASPLISCHARAVPDIVKYRSLGDWFGPLDKQSERGTTPAAISTTAIDAAIEAVKAGFAAGNEELPDYLADYLRAWLVKVTGLVRCYLNALLQQPEQLPRCLWTGTGGNIWARILRHAIRRIGGRVTGHDHGTGAGLLQSTALTGIIAFESCDVFVTFTESRVSALREGLHKDLLIPSQAPDIISVPTCKRTGLPTKYQNLLQFSSKSHSRTLKDRRLMYISTLYDGERMHGIPPLPDLVAVDWQARLLDRLSKWGYEILHKPHPEGASRPPAGFAKQFGVKMLTQPFEQVMSLADVFLFDFPLSTTFGVALISETPMVLIDFGLVDWVPEAYDKLKRRCRIVRGWFDEANRAQVDWNELRVAIEESGDLMDSSFLETYLKYWE